MRSAGMGEGPSHKSETTRCVSTAVFPLPAAALTSRVPPLYHYESKSRGLENTPEKKARLQKEVDHFRERYRDFLKKGDPYYNPNLSIVRGDCAFRMAYEKKDEIV